MIVIKSCLVFIFLVISTYFLSFFCYIFQVTYIWPKHNKTGNSVFCCVTRIFVVAPVWPRLWKHSWGAPGSMISCKCYYYCVEAVTESPAIQTTSSINISTHTQKKSAPGALQHRFPQLSSSCMRNIQVALYFCLYAACVYGCIRAKHSWNANVIYTRFITCALSV